MQKNHLERFTHAFAKWSGSGKGFISAIVSILLWLIFGVLFHYSNSWENALAIYIGIITFLMIFLVQRSQNKELLALHVKLNELIAVTKEADNSIINIEEKTEKHIEEIHDTHGNLAHKDYD